MRSSLPDKSRNQNVGNHQAIFNFQQQNQKTKSDRTKKKLTLVIEIHKSGIFLKNPTFPLSQFLVCAYICSSMMSPFNLNGWAGLLWLHRRNVFSGNRKMHCRSVPSILGKTVISKRLGYQQLYLKRAYNDYLHRYNSSNQHSLVFITGDFFIASC